VSFDVFGDFETRGYLRNFQGLKDPAEVKELEHRHFRKNIDEAIEHLRQLNPITYQDVLDTHKILFGAVYPWAGQDRLTTAPHVGISRGGRDDLFAHPEDMQATADYALKLGQDKFHMARHPGEVMGYLAHAHPFLDGNGRTILVVHTELAYRAGISIHWRQTDKDAYIAALTRELDRPGKGELDDYLKPFLGRAIRRERAAALLRGLRGLAPAADRDQADRIEDLENGLER
jgi:cell filamentation protein